MQVSRLIELLQKVPADSNVAIGMMRFSDYASEVKQVHYVESMGLVVIDTDHQDAVFEVDQSAMEYLGNSIEKTPRAD